MNYLSPALPERFWDKTIPEPNSGCWLWLGATSGSGHAQLAVKQGTRYAHRLAWELMHGPVSVGLELDHRCRVACCVNPSHLEAVTHRVNVRRGDAGGYQARKTVCPKGHPYDRTNTYQAAPCASRTQRNRQCRVCKRDNMRRYRAEKAN